MKLPNVSLIGAGRVAHVLGQALVNSGVEIRWVYSRTPQKARELAKILYAGFAEDLNFPKDPYTLVLICVNDDSIPEVSRSLPAGDYKVAHTSGVTPIDVLKSHHKHAGIFYPLQTFSEGREPDFGTIPICLEATDNPTSAILELLANKISGSVHFINGEQRKWLHVAAVFASNFSNYMYSLASTILEQHNLPFELLHPLIIETASKATDRLPADAQTGPARRGDLETLRAHEALLGSDENLLKIYKLLSQSLYQKYHGD